MPPVELENPVSSAPPADEASSLAVRPRARYFLWLVLPTLLFYVLPIALIRVPGFERWGGSTYGPALDFGFRTAGRNADVVIFGDSTALNGVSPRLLSQELGASVLNLPNTGGSLPVTDDLALARYLRTNRPPRLIVLYFTPWDLDYRAHPMPQRFEGEEMLARNGTASQILAYVREHPLATLQFPLQLYSVAPRASIAALLRREDRAASVESTMGHIDARGSTHLAPSCVFPDSMISSSGFASVQALAARYRSPHTAVVVFLAPIPDCANINLMAPIPYADIGASPPHILPAPLFWQDYNYAHVDPVFVPEVTNLLAMHVQHSLDAAPPSSHAAVQPYPSPR